jgi:hypothetical protein
MFCSVVNRPNKVKLTRRYKGEDHSTIDGVS